MTKINGFINIWIIIAVVVFAVLIGGFAQIYTIYHQTNGISIKDTSQKAARMVKIGVLVASDVQLDDVKGLEQGLAGLGYKEGKNLTIDVENPKGDPLLTQQLAGKIISESPDVIIPISTTATTVIKKSLGGTKIPIVFVDVGNFGGLNIQNIQKPGADMTGMVNEQIQTTPKRMEILKEAVPNAKTFAILLNNHSTDSPNILKVYNQAAQNMGITLKVYNYSDQQSLLTSLSDLINDKPDGYILTQDPLLTKDANIKLVTQALMKAKIPSISDDFNPTQSGFLFNFGANRYSVGEQAAPIVVKILKGQNAGDIPIQFFTNLTFQINMHVAKSIGFNVPDSLMAKANIINK